VATWGDFEECEICGNPFVAFVEGVKVCIPCRKAAAGDRLSKSDLTVMNLHVFYKKMIEQIGEKMLAAQKALALERERVASGKLVVSLGEEISRLRKELSDEQKRNEFLRGRLGTAFDHTGFTQEQITTLIKLAHPDKHNNSQDANEATKLLLAMRQK
jgi:hypothetical protein